MTSSATCVFVLRLRLDLSAELLVHGVLLSSAWWRMRRVKMRNWKNDIVNAGKSWSASGSPVCCSGAERDEICTGEDDKEERTMRPMTAVVAVDSTALHWGGIWIMKQSFYQHPVPFDLSIQFNTTIRQIEYALHVRHREQQSVPIPSCTYYYYFYVHIESRSPRKRSIERVLLYVLNLSAALPLDE